MTKTFPVWQEGMETSWDPYDQRPAGRRLAIQEQQLPHHRKYLNSVTECGTCIQALGIKQECQTLGRMIVSFNTSRSYKMIIAKISI